MAWAEGMIHTEKMEKLTVVKLVEQTLVSQQVLQAEDHLVAVRVGQHLGPVQVVE